MKLLKAIALWRKAIRIKKSLKEADMNKVKSGFKTTEFWLAVLAGLLAAGNQHLGLNLPVESMLSLSGVAISYIIGRSLAKKAN